jgi:hypothetical protein
MTDIIYNFLQGVGIAFIIFLGGFLYVLFKILWDKEK